jgi:hypothetical protein
LKLPEEIDNLRRISSKNYVNFSRIPQRGLKIVGGNSSDRRVALDNGTNGIFKYLRLTAVLAFVVINRFEINQFHLHFLKQKSK